MLKKSFIVFAVFFVICNIVATYNKPDTRYANTDAQINMINADQYIYSNQTYKAVILGSSLANKMVVSALPGFYNLSLSGMSIYDGGAVLLSCKTIPKTVFIELNVIQRPKNENFSQEFESPAYLYAKRILPALRTENQPVILVKKAIDDIKATMRTKPKVKYVSNKKIELKNSYLPQSMFKPLLAIQIKAYSDPDSNSVDKGIASLKQLVSTIEARGSRVIFFEMPINPMLEQLPKTVLIRNSVKKNFPNYPFIDLPSATFKTRDGLHLAQKEAMDYTLYFKNQVDTISRLN
jgi:hypothetical protein